MLGLQEGSEVRTVDVRVAEVIVVYGYKPRLPSGVDAPVVNIGNGVTWGTKTIIIVSLASGVS